MKLSSEWDLTFMLFVFELDLEMAILNDKNLLIGNLVGLIDIIQNKIHTS